MYTVNVHCLMFMYTVYCQLQCIVLYGVQSVEVYFRCVDSNYIPLTVFINCSVYDKVYSNLYIDMIISSIIIVFNASMSRDLYYQKP